MTQKCPNPLCPPDQACLFGSYHRKSDGRCIQRYRCRCCSATFSEASGTPCFGQKKRFLNPVILKALASGMSQNRLAIILNTTRVTVARKLKFLAAECAKGNAAHNYALAPAKEVQFDELETFEHTKSKPLSVALAVEKKTRRILGIKVSSMPAKGPLAMFSRRKYGLRPDGRSMCLRELFGEIAPLCAGKVKLQSDKCPRYERIVKATLGADPAREVAYSQTKGARGSSTGQGEIKMLRYDPLFSLNHTCAMLRANINRLFRRTWNTTKKLERLRMHLEIYAFFHNTKLIKSPNPATC